MAVVSSRRRTIPGPTTSTISNSSPPASRAARSALSPDESMNVTSAMSTITLADPRSIMASSAV